MTGYLFVIARNLWISNKRRDVKISYVDQLFDLEDKPNLNDGNELARLVNNLLNQLGDTCKKLLHLTYFEENSLQQATQKMKLSNASVTRTYHYRCKKKLLSLVKGNQLLKDLMYQS